MLLNVGDIVQMRKSHPCGSLTWRVIRVGADVKIRCQGCDHIVMMERGDFEKRVKRVVQSAVQEEPQKD